MVKRLLILGLPCAVVALASALGLLTLVSAAAAAPAQRYGTHNLVPGQAVLAADRSSAHAIYKGLEIRGDSLFATDFHNGRVDREQAREALLQVVASERETAKPG